MKKIFLGVLTFSFYGYFIIAAFIFTPYYNYKYANRNGFIKWMLFGEIIPTAKSFLWPYYWFNPEPIKNTNAVLDTESMMFISKIRDDAHELVILFNESTMIIDKQDLFSQMMDSIKIYVGATSKIERDSLKKFMDFYISSLDTVNIEIANSIQDNGTVLTKNVFSENTLSKIKIISIDFEFPYEKYIQYLDTTLLNVSRFRAKFIDISPIDAKNHSELVRDYILRQNNRRDSVYTILVNKNAFY